MKSNKRRKELSSEIATREKLPVELVATTALYFLCDRAERRHPLVQRTAIDAAVYFLKMCAKQIEAEQRIDAEREEHQKEFERLGWKDDDIISYNEGIKFITRQERLDRAQAYYEALVKNNYLFQKPSTESEVRAEIKKDKGNGFVARLLPLRRYEFDRSRASGLLDLKRRTKIQKKT